MKYAVAMIYIPSFIRIGSDIQKLAGGIQRDTDAQTAWKSHKPAFIFSK
jgi:hypothetical protein